MDQILLRRSDKHTPRLSAERIPSRLSNACAEACNITNTCSTIRLWTFCTRSTYILTSKRWKVISADKIELIGSRLRANCVLIAC